MLTTDQIIVMVAGMVGGLALFLFGMNAMSSSLTQFAGGGLENMLGKVTKNRYISWLFGTGVTAIVQSSSATTVLTVGLVNSGIMKLSQTVGLIIGANLGTTATAWLLSLNGIQGDSSLMVILKPSTFMPFIAIVGVAMYMFARSDRKKLIGSILIGFGIMMIGMSLMSSAVAPLKDVPGLEDRMIHFSLPVLGFLFALIFTMIIQSSDATIGILQTLAITVSVNFRMAVVIVCGAQIGTCITAILASLGSGKNAKRTALIQLYYNLIKNIPFIIVLLILDSTMTLPFMSSQISTVGIATFHSCINLVFSMIMLPMAGVLVKLVVKTIPYTEQEKQEQKDTLQYLDPLLLRNPGLAIAQAHKATSAVADSIQKAFSEWLDGRFEESEQHCLRALRYIHQAESYMTKLTKKRLMDNESKAIQYLRQICGDLRIISNQTATLAKNHEEASVLCSATEADLKVYGSAIQETIEIVSEGFEVQSDQIAGTVQVFRGVIDGLFHKINARQISRIHSGESSSEAGIPFMEICFAYERIMDRCDHIAGILLNYNAIGPTSLPPIKPQSQEAQKPKYNQIQTLFRDKYSMLK